MAKRSLATWGGVSRPAEGPGRRVSSLLQSRRHKMMLSYPSTELIIEETEVKGRIHKRWKLLVKEAKGGSKMTGI